MNSKKQNLGMAVVAFAGLSLAMRAGAAPSPHFHVFLAFGQSNLDGQAPAEAQDQVVDPRFLVLSTLTCSSTSDNNEHVSRTEGQWASAVAPIVRCDTHLGPLDWFGRTLADSLLPSTDTVGVIAAAVDGTPIVGFVPNGVGKAYYASQANGSASYEYTEANEVGGDPYARIVAMAKIAQQRGVIRGILMHQGETDAGTAHWADTVKIVYDSLLADLGLSAANVPLLAGETLLYNAPIDALPNTIPTAHVISASGLVVGTYTGNDGVHFSPESYRTLGNRYAHEMATLMKTTSLAPTMEQPISAAGTYAVFDLRGTRMAGFHALDAASATGGWNGVRKGLPEGVYLLRNATTGRSLKVLNGTD